MPLRTLADSASLLIAGAAGTLLSRQRYFVILVLVVLLQCVSVQTI